MGDFVILWKTTWFSGKFSAFWGGWRIGRGGVVSRKTGGNCGKVWDFSENGEKCWSLWKTGGKWWYFAENEEIWGKSAVFLGHLRNFVEMCRILRKFAEKCGIPRKFVEKCGISRKFAEICGKMRDFVEICGILRGLSENDVKYGKHCGKMWFWWKSASAEPDSRLLRRDQKIKKIM